MFHFPFKPMKSSTQTELAGNRAAFSECMQNKPKIEFLQLCKFRVRVFSDVIDRHLMQQFAHQIFLHRTYFRKMIINLLSYAKHTFLRNKIKCLGETNFFFIEIRAY